MKNAFFFLFMACSLFFLTSCDQDDPMPDEPIKSFDNGVFISCEGAFGQGNAVVYFLDLARSEYVPEIYRTINQKPVGDVLQSMQFENDKAYMVVNNSGKIIEVEKETFQETGSISGLNSPTEIEIENGKGYIGSLYSDHILVADMVGLTITDTLYLGEQSNFIREEDNHLWVLSQSEYQGRVKNHVYHINLSNGVVDSLAVGANPLHWAFGEDDELFVYCQGTEAGDNPSIYTINTVNHTVEGKTDLDVNAGFFSRLAYDDYSDRLLVQLADGIYTYQSQGNISDSPLIPLQDVEFVYAMDVDPNNGRIYLGDARDFASAGGVLIFTNEGELFATIPQVGIGPNHFYFE